MAGTLWKVIHVLEGFLQVDRPEMLERLQATIYVKSTPDLIYDSVDLCFGDFARRSWNEMCGIKIHRMAAVRRGE